MSIRITNAMMTNTTLMHVQRNMRQLDDIIRQIETGKRANRPSDNPLVASRALQFRTSVRENEQHLANLHQGLAWMNITESTFTSINATLMHEIRQLAVAADGADNLHGKQIMIEQMRSLFEEIGNSVNHTFAGQYIFSGFRTNEPPTFRTDNNRTFVITQHFDLRDISREQSFQRLADPNNAWLVTPELEDIAVIRLAFAEMNTTPLGALTGPGVGFPTEDPISRAVWPEHVDSPAGIHIPGFHIRKVSIHDPQAYLPPQTHNGLPMLHLIAETGELVMHRETAEAFPREGISVTYQKNGFRKGDINPSVYFTSREILDTALPGQTGVPAANTIYQITQYFSRAAGTPDNGFYEFELVYPVYANTGGHAGLNTILPPGAEIDGNTVRIPVHLFGTQTNISVTYHTANPHLDLPTPIPEFINSEGNSVPITHIKQDPRIQGVTLVRAHDTTGVPVRLETVDLNRSFDMHNQEIQYEVATRTLITVNSLAKNVLTDKMFADFRRFFQFAESLHITPQVELEQFFSDLGYEGEALERAVSTRLIDEESRAASALSTQLNNMLLLIARHSQQTNQGQTELGARMVRMELIQDRLEQDEVTYNRLMSDNENTDLVRATILRMSAEAAFMASLRANTGIVQMSLANFMR